MITATRRFWMIALSSMACTGIAVALVPPNPGPNDVATSYSAVTPLNPVTVSDAECMTFSSCPVTILIDTSSSQTYLGCTNNGTTCVGDCYSCSGGQLEINLCAFSKLSRCNIGLGPITSCGDKRRHANGCTSTKPSGDPIAVDGCYCDTSVGTVIVSSACTIIPCQK